MDAKSKKVYKIVLTGGPCGGKTTGQSRLCSFFENLGWKVYRSPECATVLMAGGIKFPELSDEAAYTFQCNLLRCMMQVERTYVDLAEKCEKNCLVICDRGTMDVSTYMSSDDWERLKTDLKLNQVDLRDGRYDQVIHMVSAAKGAEDFYTTDHHMTRYEDPEHARRLDDMALQAWVGHPYYDVIDNSTDFEKKLIRMIGSVCDRLGLAIGDRLNIHSKKRKFLVSEIPAAEVFPQFQDFDVIHDYLVTPSRKMQARVRKRGQNGSWTYSHTIRRPEINGQVVEVRQQITARDYHNLLAQRDQNHCSIVKMRRCFLWRDQYFQLDVYQDPCTPRCRDLIFLETYTTVKVGIDIPLPDFLKIEKDVTGDPHYSMFNLSLEDNTCVKRSSLMNGFRASSIDIIDTSLLGSSPNALCSSAPNTSWGSPSNTWFGSPPRSFSGFPKSADITQNDMKLSHCDANHNSSEADLMHYQ